MDIAPLWRNLILSLCAGLLILVIISRHEIPSPLVIYTYLYESQPKGFAKGFGKDVVMFGNAITLPKPKKSIQEITDEINAELQEMPDVRLRSISMAQKPCASGLIDCRGMSEGWVTRVALAEVADRAKKLDQEIARQNAEANRRNAEIAARNLWITGCGGAVAGGMLVFAGLTYREGRRKNREEEARATAAIQPTEPATQNGTRTPGGTTTTTNPNP
jgi:hypothetical protein